MKKLSATVLAGAALLTTSCTPFNTIESAPSSPAETSHPVSAHAEESPRAFVFESGVLEFGDFDPYTLGDNLFNPCTEITPEEFAAAGFPDVDLSDGGQSFNGLAACQIASSEEQLTRSITTSIDNGNTNRRMIEAQGLLLPQYRSELIPELFAFAANDLDPGYCFTQIDTERGGLGASAGGETRLVTLDEMCELAIQTAEQLFAAFGSDVH